MRYKLVVRNLNSAFRNSVFCKSRHCQLFTHSRQDAYFPLSHCSTLINLTVYRACLVLQPFKNLTCAINQVTPWLRLSFVSRCIHNLFFIFGVQQFDHDASEHGFLWISPLWDFIKFLESENVCFKEVWESFSHHGFNFFTLLYSRNSHNIVNNYFSLKILIKNKMKCTLQWWLLTRKEGSLSWGEQSWPLSSCTFCPDEVRDYGRSLPLGVVEWLCFSSSHRNI